MRDFLVFLGLFPTPFCYGARILMIPVPFKSHVLSMLATGRALKGEGHHMVMIAPDEFERTISEDGVEVWSFPNQNITDLQRFIVKETTPMLAQGEILSSMYSSSTILFSTFRDLCHGLLSNVTLMEQTYSHMFDLAIVEGVHMFSCINIIPYKFDIPFVLYSTFVPPWGAGVNSMPSVEPSPLIPFTTEMTFLQRMTNLLLYMTIHVMLPTPNELVELHVSDQPQISLDEMMRKAEIFLVIFEQWCLDYPRISAPHYQFIGSNSAKPVQPLSDDLEMFANGAEHGLVVLSYGSSPEFRQALTIHINKFIDAFRKIPQKVLIASECGQTIPDNVRCLGWIPQNDLLGHPKTVLFITHGGTNGQMEAVRHGVPMISIGVMSEQIYNSKRIEYHGYGKQLYLHEFTPEDLTKAIHDITTNRTYHLNVKKCASIIQSFQSREKQLVFWVNHILEFGGSHLHPRSLDMPLYQLFMIDVIVIVLLMFWSMACICFCSCYILSKKCCKRGKHVKTD